MLKRTLEKAGKNAASALEIEVVGNRHSWDEASSEDAAEEKTFTLTLTEPDGKTPVRGEEAGKHGDFIPIPLNVSKSPLRTPLALLILVPAFRILLFSEMLYRLFGAVCMYWAGRAASRSPAGSWQYCHLAGPGVNGCSGCSSSARLSLIYSLAKEIFQVGKWHIRVLAWVWIALESLSNIFLATLKLFKRHNNLHPQF